MNIFYCLEKTNY